MDAYEPTVPAPQVIATDEACHVLQALEVATREPPHARPRQLRAAMMMARASLGPSLSAQPFGARLPESSLIRSAATAARLGAKTSSAPTG
jgi:hypothetical protein